MANTRSNKILMGLADRPGEDMTARLLLALTALYVERPTHTGEEEQAVCPFTFEATRPQCECEGCPDWPGRASRKEGES